MKDLKEIKLEDLKCPTNLPLSGVLPPVDRIIVIGDIHGDFKRLTEMLSVAKLIDQHYNWIGGSTVLVQIGDIIDSCRKEYCINPSNDTDDDLRCLVYLVELHQQALKVGGAVYTLLGNHEIMNVNGNMSYVSPKNFEAFLKLFPKYSSGVEARKFAFQPGNPLANFLACSKLGALIIGNLLFVHGGMAPEIAKHYRPVEINFIIKSWLENKISSPEDIKKMKLYSKLSPLIKKLLDDKLSDFPTHVNNLIFNKESILWNRNLGTLPSDLPMEDKRCQEYSKPLLNSIKVGDDDTAHSIFVIFIGHTPQMSKGINSTCDDTVYRVDYGSSKAFDPWDKSGRTGPRKTQVLEILDNGKKINVIS